MARYERNREKNGIEIYFDGKPSEDVIAELKGNRWRWFPSKRCWYTRYSSDSELLAKRLCEEQAVATPKPAAGSTRSPQRETTATRSVPSTLSQNTPKTKTKTSALQFDTSIIMRDRALEQRLGIQDINFYAYKTPGGKVEIVGEVIAPANIRKSLRFSCTLYDGDGDVIETRSNLQYGSTSHLTPETFFDRYPVRFGFTFVKTEIKRIKIVPVEKN